MKTSETFTIVKTGTDSHYDPNEERFYSASWERTQDSKEYLQMVMENNPEKFEGCEIQDNQF
jgi:hypothetical protein